MVCGSARGFGEPDRNQMEAGDGIGPAAVAVEGTRVEAAGRAAVGEEGTGAAVEPGARRLEDWSKWRQCEGGERHGGILSALGGRCGLAAVELGGLLSVAERSR